MESRVLLPEELVLCAKNNRECSSSVARLLEQTVGVAARVPLPTGHVFFPLQGTVRVGKLDIYSTLPDSDVRHDCGAWEEVLELARGRIRQCNWVRFLQTSPDHPPTQRESSQGAESSDQPGLEANLHYRPNWVTANGQMAFEVVRELAAGDELVVDFGQIGEKNAPKTTSPSSILIGAISQLMSESPMDLSIPLLRQPLSLSPSKPPEIKPVPALSIYCGTDSNASSSEDSELSVSLSNSSKSPTWLSPDRPSSTDTQSSVDTHTNIVIHVNSSNNNNPHVVHPHSGRSSRPKEGTKKGSKSKRMLSCSFCAKCFDRPSLLNRHLRTHTGERPHVCDICSKGFSTSSSLNTHRRIHSGEKPHSCGVCGKRFTASSNLYYHRMTHVKEKPHKCELCQKSFPTPGDLKSHMYIHNGSWPHRCHICDRGFSKVTNLKNHIFLHSGNMNMLPKIPHDGHAQIAVEDRQKPHRCSKCGKCFALGCNMKAHMKTHED
eukprot:maker-scaffold424_size175595-snap-gene-0.23 protein:Tk01551 transcript:maker-scaffold424_size175595-snap-gene-0.23-mRNA-1 annotation:"zinc finger protein 235-like isoform x1"